MNDITMMNDIAFARKAEDTTWGLALKIKLPGGDCLTRYVNVTTEEIVQLLRRRKEKFNKPDEWEEVGETERGYMIYRERNELGQWRYWSDSIGGGVVVWDTTLVSKDELRFVLKAEANAED